MPAISVRECKTAAEVFANYRGVKERREARERMCLMKAMVPVGPDLDLDNTALAPPPNDSAAAKFQQAVVESLPVIAEQLPIVANAPVEEEPIAPMHSVTMIVRGVASYYGKDAIDLVSRRRTADIVRPRQIAMYLAKKLTLKSLPEIGRRMGDKDHTTVLHAVRKIETLVANDPKFADQINHLRGILVMTSSFLHKVSGASSSAP